MHTKPGLIVTAAAAAVALAAPVLAGGAASARATPDAIGNPAVVRPADGEADRSFGSEVAIDGDTMVVGAPCDDITGGSGFHCDGSAYVFVRTDAGWVQQAKIVPADIERGDGFGGAVAVSGDTVVIGAPNDRLGTGVRYGAAYVFVRSGGTWTQQAELAQPTRESNDVFGNAVDIDGDTLVVGDVGDNLGGKTYAGSAWVFVRTGARWSAGTELQAPQPQGFEAFGAEVALQGDLILVGAPGNLFGTSTPGAVYTFRRTDGGWRSAATLTAADGTPRAQFGQSVAFDGDTAAIGAPNKSPYPTAYIFVRAGRTWTQQAVLHDRDDNGSFGAEIAIAGDTVIVGDLSDNSPMFEDSGEAYVFTRVDGEWGYSARLLRKRPAESDTFGGAIAADADQVAIGGDTSPTETVSIYAR